METPPEISVIIPVYKVEPYIRQCLDSVVNQTYSNLEIIVIDDGSPDNCGKICDEYAQKDDRIQVIHKKNGGLCAARNDGINRATGKWITFVDSDDWLDLDYYEYMIAALEETDADIVCSQGDIIETPGDSIEIHYFEEPGKFDGGKNHDFLVKKILVQDRKKGYGLSLGSVWDKFFRTSFIHRNNLLFDISLKAWEDLWFNLQACSKVQCVTAVMDTGYHYRMVPNSITKSFNVNRPKINYDFICRINTLERDHNAVIESSLDARAISLISHSLRFCYFHPENKENYRSIAKRVKEMKTWPYYQKAIWSSNNRYLTKKQIILKYVLRLPWIWPLKLIYSARWMFKK